MGGKGRGAGPGAGQLFSWSGLFVMENLLPACSEERGGYCWLSLKYSEDLGAKTQLLAKFYLGSTMMKKSLIYGWASRESPLFPSSYKLKGTN